MTSFRLGMLDKHLLAHLERGGTLADEIGETLLRRFLHRALKNADIKRAVEEYGFNQTDLTLLYRTMVESLMPNPAIKSGAQHLSRMLAASLPFYEPVRLDEILRIAREGADENAITGIQALTDDRAKRKYALRQVGIAVAQKVRDVHGQEFGEPEFTIRQGGKGLEYVPSGCLTVLVLVLLPIGVFLVAR